MSAISQQLQRARLSRAESSGNESGLYPGGASFGSKHPGNPNRLDRAVSSSSAGPGRFVSSIDEEQSDFVFSMEEEDDNKRSSGGWNYPVGGRSPHLGAISSGRSGTSGQDAKDGKEYLKEMESLYHR